jgi:triacylglycerol lipase
MIVTIALLVVFGVLAAIITAQVVCVAIALYDGLNLPDARGARLTRATVRGIVGPFVMDTVTIIVLVLAAPLSWLPWRQPPRHAALSRPPVVLVPPWPFPRLATWALRRRLRRDGWPPPVTASYGLRSRDALNAARRVRTAVDGILARTGARSVVLVAHGVGGVVCRMYLRELGGLGKVGKLVTLATPHQGSKLAAIVPHELAQELRPGSRLLHDLAEDDPVPASVDVTAIAAGDDLYVLPAALAQYPGAGNIVVEGVSHFGMLWSTRVYELVRENLEYDPWGLEHGRPRAAAHDG